jgi:uncharacterized damage-inducible protein DinB
MTIAESLVQDFDQEMATTRRVLERVPEQAAAWRPHPKSMSMGELAQHVVDLVGFAPTTFDRTDLDFANPETAKLTAARFETTMKLVAMFDERRATAHKAIAAASDTDMGGLWTLRVGPRKIFTLPRSGVIRSFILSHLIHHRGQLSVYLRLNDVPLPPIYGPTADEAPGGAGPK